MSFFSTVKSLLLGSPKTVDDIFDKDDGILVKAGGFIGGLVYSDQEKAEMNKQIVVAAQKFVVDTLDESTERSKARREVANLVIKFYVLLLFLSGITFPFNEDWSQMWFSLAMNWQLGGLVSGVCMFFFGVHVIRTTRERK